jgi:hypothetical protein
VGTGEDIDKCTEKYFLLKSQMCSSVSRISIHPPPPTSKNRFPLT